MRQKRKRDDLMNYVAQYADMLARASESFASHPHARIDNLFPHYTNTHFNTPRTVYLLTGHRLTDGYVTGATYAYSDRLHQWHYARRDAARDAALAAHPDTSTAAHCEAYLRSLLNDDGLTLVHIMAGVNLGNGYPYQIYGYISSAPAVKEG